MKYRTMMFAALFSLVAVSTMGCTTERVVVRGPAHHTVVVTKRPPAPKREVRPYRPSRRHVWVGGYWTWRGSKYVWVKGRWTVPPRHNGRWMAGHWSKRSSGWVWVAGYWRY